MENTENTETATWTTKDGTKIQVKDMELSHVRQTLKMLIKKYTVTCLEYGARYTSGIDTSVMSEEELRDMLSNTCINRSYLINLVAKGCRLLDDKNTEDSKNN